MIKRLLRYVGEYKGDTMRAPVFILLETIMEVAIPYLMATIIDIGLADGNMSFIVKMGLCTVLAALLSLLFGVLAGRYAAKASAGFAKNIRRELFYNVQNFSFRNIDNYSTSGLVTRLTTDVTNLQNAFQMILRTLFRAPGMMIFAMIMAFTINYKLALIFLTAVPILGIGLLFIVTRAHPIFERVFKTYDRLNKVVQENLRGIRVVKSFVREDHEEEKFKEVSGEIYKDFSMAEKILAFNSPLMQFTMYTCILLISYLGARFIVGGSMSTGQLMSVITYATQILMSLMMLSMVFVMITISRASAERILEVLGEKSDLHSPDNALTQVPDGSVQFENVQFGYRGKDGKQVLKDIQLSIKSGQTVGIIGGTGSAKTTLVQLIPRLYDVSGGSVKVGGHDVRDYDLKVLRDSVAMVLQKNELFSGTIKDNLRWGDEKATDEEMVAACEISQADGFIRQFPGGYDTVIEQGGTNVSGGQKQRLCIARALLKNPKIIIFDDSTSAVDTKTDASIRDGLKQGMPGTTQFIIAQRISSVQHADTIVVMENGYVVDVGDHETLLETSDIYREVYDSQVKGGMTRGA